MIELWILHYKERGQMKDCFYVISVFFVVIQFLKSFAFRRLRCPG